MGIRAATYLTGEGTSRAFKISSFVREFHFLKRVCCFLFVGVTCVPIFGTWYVQFFLPGFTTVVGAVGCSKEGDGGSVSPWYGVTGPLY